MPAAQVSTCAQHSGSGIYCAFDLLQLDGRDLHGEPIETRKAELARLLTGCQPLALVLNRNAPRL